MLPVLGKGSRRKDLIDSYVQCLYPEPNDMITEVSTSVFAGQELVNNSSWLSPPTA